MKRESGAHINPAVTMAFWLIRKLDWRAAIGYIVAQMLGDRAAKAQCCSASRR
jgi:aquaporin Z